MLLPTHKETLANIKQMFTDIGYELSFELLNVSDFGVPQDRKCNRINYFSIFNFMEHIYFQSKIFLLRELKISSSISVFISTTELNKVVMTENGAYVSKEAQLIDETIYYYVEPSEILLSNKKLLKLIVEETNA